MRVFAAWVLYVLLVVASYFALALIGPSITANPLLRALLALAIGAAFIILASPSIVAESSDDHTWLRILLLIAYGAPIAFAVWLLLTGRWSALTCTIERDRECDETGCTVVRERRYCGTPPEDAPFDAPFIPERLSRREAFRSSRMFDRF